MSILYYVAAALAGIMSLGHSYFGSFMFFKGVKHPPSMWGDEDVSWRFVHGGWHFLAVPLFMSCLALVGLATGYFKDPLTVAKVVFWYYTGKSAILLYYQIPRPVMFVKAPLWIGIIGIPLLILAATGGAVVTS